MSKRVFQLFKNHWMIRKDISDDVRNRYRIECCPKMISTNEQNAKSVCHVIELRTTAEIDKPESTTTAPESTTTLESTTIPESTTAPESLTEPPTTTSPVKVRKDQVCK